MTDTVDYDLSNFRSEDYFTFLHSFWSAIFLFNPLEFYVLLNDDIDLKDESKQSITEKLNQNFIHY